MSRKKTFEMSVISAKDIQVGDKLDISGKTRVHAVKDFGHNITAGIKTRGSGTGGVMSWHPTEQIKVWR